MSIPSRGQPLAAGELCPDPLPAHPRPEQTGSLLTASALGSHRSPGTLERTESWVGNTPLLLRADRPELCRTILTHGAAKPVLRFFREVDCRRHILCFCRGSLFVFARDSRLDQH